MVLAHPGAYAPGCILSPLRGWRAPMEQWRPLKRTGFFLAAFPALTRWANEMPPLKRLGRASKIKYAKFVGRPYGTLSLAARCPRTAVLG